MRTSTSTNGSISLVEKIVLYLVIITFFTDIKASYYALIAFACFWIYNKRYALSLNILSQSRIFIALSFFIGFLIVSFLYTNNLSYGLRAIEKKSGLILLPILLTGVPWNSSLRNKIFNLFILCVLTLTVYSLITTFIQFNINIGSDLSYFSWVLPLTSSLSSNYYSLFLSLAILVLVFGFRQFQSNIPKVVLVLVIFYLACFLALLGSRSAIMGIVTVLIFFAVYKIFRNRGKERKKGIVIFFLTISMSVFLISTVPYLNSRVKQIFHFTLDPRYKLLKANVKLFLKEPILGVGIGDVQDELVAEHLRSNNMEAYTNKYNAHNDWFQVLLSTGLIGFGLFLNFFFELLRNALVTKNWYRISFLLFFLVVSMTESILERNKGVIFFSFFVTMWFILPPPEMESSDSNIKVRPER